MGKTAKKTDGLAILLRNGTLPTVWIPPAELRDQRELLRLRMFFVRQQTWLKNRIHGALARYNLRVGVQDIYSVEGRLLLEARLGQLPPHTEESIQRQLTTLDVVALEIEEVEKRLQEIMQTTPQAELLKTLPGVGRILSMLIALEVGDVGRFPSSARLASYSGLVPRVRSSGGRTRMGQVCGDVNRYLKWAFVEAANVTVMHGRRLAGRHVVELYRRVKRKQNHQKAAVAVARHLAEAALLGLEETGGLSRSAEELAT